MITTSFAALFGFMAGILVLVVQMTILFLVNDTQFEPWHKLDFNYYPDLLAAAILIGGINLIPTWLFIIFPIDRLSSRLNLTGLHLSLFCGFIGLSSSAFISFCLLGLSDPLLNILHILHWTTAGAATGLFLSLLRKAEQGAAANP